MSLENPQGDFYLRFITELGQLVEERGRNLNAIVEYLNTVGEIPYGVLASSLLLKGRENDSSGGD